MSSSFARWVQVGVIVVAAAVGCAKKGGDKAPGPGSGSATTPTAATRGADSGEAAAKQLFGALVKGDLEATKRLLPDSEACKALPALTGCDQIVSVVSSQWPSLTPMLAKYAGGVPVKTTAAPMPGAEQWNVAVAGQPPMQLLVFPAGGRFFAVAHLGELAPPSTGHEMPQAVSMKPAEAKTLVAAALDAFGKPSPDCNKIADELMLAIPVAYADVNADSAPAFRALQKCALETQRWRSAVQAGSALLPIDHGRFIVAQIVRALAEMGDYQNAIATGKQLAAKYPDTTDAVISAVVYAVCKSESWPDCLKTSEAALTELAEKKLDPKGDSMVTTRFLRDVAWVVTGKPKEAIADLDQLDKLLGMQPAFEAPVRADAQKTIERGYYLEVVPVPQLATGVYHLMGKVATGALVTIKMGEQTGKARTFRVEAEVPGVTERSSNTLELGAKQWSVRYANPPLKIDLDLDKIRSPRPSQLAFKLIETTGGVDKVVIDETVPLDVLPRNYLPLRRKIGADAELPTYGYLGAWITSNAPGVDEFLAKAKLRLPSKAFAGEQDVTAPQVKAIFDELKARGMSYVMDPNVTSTTSFVQRTRLPAEVLTTTNAQCLEGTLLFATLMESIGLQPIIVLVPGHAFVGWHTIAQDGTHGEPLFVETTMVGGFNFEEAEKVATDRVAKELKDGAFKSGASTVIDVTEIRKQGFLAQPQ